MQFKPHNKVVPFVRVSRECAVHLVRINWSINLVEHSSRMNCRQIIWLQTKNESWAKNKTSWKTKEKRHKRIQHTITTIKCDVYVGAAAVAVAAAAIVVVDDDDDDAASVRHKSSRHFPLSRDDARTLVNKPHWSCAEREIVFNIVLKLHIPTIVSIESREPKPETRSIWIPARTFMV